MKPTIAWAWFWEHERGYNPRVRAAAAGANGCYAFRDGETREILYVGESHTGRLWKTCLRHFQGLASGLFEQRSEWVWSERENVEVQLWVERSAQQALDLETELIARYAPTNESRSYEPDWNLIMGRSTDADDKEEAPF